MPIQTQTIKFKLSSPPTSVGAEISTIIDAINPADLVQVEYRRKDTSRTDDAELQITYRTPGVSTYGVVVFEATPLLRADQVADAFFAANPTYRAKKVIDLTPVSLRNILVDAVCVIYGTCYCNEAVPGKGGLRIVVTSENIPPGGTGLARLWTNSLPITEQFTIENRGQNLWLTNTLGWGAPDPATGQWAGVYGCCDPIPPMPPINVQANAQSNTEILLQWDNPNGCLGLDVEFDIERRITGVIPWTPVIATPPCDVSYLDVGLAPSTEYEYRIRSRWSGSLVVSAWMVPVFTGGTIVPVVDGGIDWTQHSFTAAGANALASQTGGKLSYLLYGGGGGGGYGAGHGGGGGGAAQRVRQDGLFTPMGSYATDVGAGGQPAIPSVQASTDGLPSSIVGGPINLVSLGGGRGASGAPGADIVEASAGGTASDQGVGVFWTGDQSDGGPRGPGSGANNRGAGGGGGVAADGQAGPAQGVGGDGGDGVSDWGVFRGAGGGGAVRFGTPPGGGFGGNGGGGRGTAGGGVNSGTAGAVNTGSGGGGGTSSGTSRGFDGGRGVIITRYRTNVSTYEDTGAPFPILAPTISDATQVGNVIDVTSFGTYQNPITSVDYVLQLDGVDIPGTSGTWIWGDPLPLGIYTVALTDLAHEIRLKAVAVNVFDSAEVFSINQLVAKAEWLFGTDPGRVTTAGWSFSGGAPGASQTLQPQDVRITAATSNSCSVLSRAIPTILDLNEILVESDTQRPSQFFDTVGVFALSSSISGTTGSYPSGNGILCSVENNSGSPRMRIYDINAASIINEAALAGPLPTNILMSLRVVDNGVTNVVTFRLTNTDTMTFQEISADIGPGWSGTRVGIIHRATNRSKDFGHINVEVAP